MYKIKKQVTHIDSIISSRKSFKNFGLRIKTHIDSIILVIRS